MTTHSASPDATEALLTPGQVAELLGVRPATLRDWRRIHAGPDCIQVAPQTWRYERSAIRDYLESNRLSRRLDQAV